jgi:nicotinamide riboside transporter PnuC
MDWLTGLMTILAMELLARRDWRGWLVGLLNQFLWAYLIYERRLYGLAPLTIILTWRYLVALCKWRRSDG